MNPTPRSAQPLSNRTESLMCNTQNSFYINRMLHLNATPLKTKASRSLPRLRHLGGMNSGSGQWLSFKKSNKFQNPFKEGKKKSERLRIYCQSSAPTSQREAFPSLQKRRALTLCLTPGWGHMVQPSLVATQDIVENVSPSGFASKSS